ncbi:larval cuticle protein A2B-like [Sitophilus oryzae]|uniref:Larval cuticle protein A2B-like n=1 Tax=Sitophilus oryzae TaxID=7048 RepID=A0A6J2XFK5_SITOR|nr:larval cuticle protein A2B-like [Sitophilus oryzae]
MARVQEAVLVLSIIMASAAGITFHYGGYSGMGVGHIVQPVIASVPFVQTHSEPFDHHPIYGYSYTVHDTHSGDTKTQVETRNGDSVRGHYSFMEPDGSRRTVHYTAEPHTGFNAVVHRTPPQGN